ncbi:MAG: nuclear transport factor 2 family protein [Bacteroidetes bacterium]|nr:nuclear transport factor 2 family protein [Bacteroidota bacterium]
MRKDLFFVCLLTALVAMVRPSHAQQNADSLRSRLTIILDKWHRDASECKHEDYIGAMSPNGVFIGTDATEYWTIAEFRVWTKPYFDRGKAWTFKAIHRNIYIGKDGTTAWFDELLNTHMGVCRGSGVLQKRDGLWKIEQYVLSSTIPNDQMKTITRNKAKTDSLFILKIKIDSIVK